MSGPARPRFAMVIGSGGLRCVSAFGALSVLKREGIGIDLVVACSGGSVCGFWIASGQQDTAAGAARFAEGWSATFGDLAYMRILGAVFPRWFGFEENFGLMKDAGLNEALANTLQDVRFEDLAIPLHFVATDVHTGEKVVLSSGPVFDAMRATMAIPLVIPPWKIDGRLLMDGAVCDPLPVDVAIREGADIIVAIGFEETLAPQIQSGVGMARQVLAAGTNHLLRAQFAFQNLVHHAEVIAIIPDFGDMAGLKGADLVAHLVRQGERATESQVPYLRRLLQASGHAAVQRT